MNYRHSYHAGNFADVFKHSILTLLIQKLSQKEKPFCYIDTHAGTGCYDLRSRETQKTKEYLSGIAKVITQEEYPSDLEKYFAIIKQLNAGTSDLHYYPGSPYFVSKLLRSQDRMILMELHKEDAQILKQNFSNNKQIIVHHYDGYLGLKAFLPPKEKRGLVLIDPPFEEKDEFTKIITGLKTALERWRNGIYAIWYPIKDQTAAADFLAQLQALSPNKILTSKISINIPKAFQDVARRKRKRAAEHTKTYVSSEPSLQQSHILKGEGYKQQDQNQFVSCGMAIVNPPWLLEEQLNKIVPWLQEKMLTI
jgi:23S rRNA (adenine2030-N6)-methyltransferase